MTSLPLFHINAPAYSVLGSLAVGAGLVLVPRFSASGFLDSARRHGATEFNAIGAMLEILMRQPVRPDDAETDLRLCYTGPSPAREWQEAFEEQVRPAGRLRLCDVGVAVRPDLAARHAAVRHARLAPPAPDAGHRQRGSGGRRRGTRPRRRERPASCCCATRPSRRATGRCRRRPRRRSSTAGCTPATSSPANADGTYTFVARKKEVLRRRGQNLSPAEVEDAIATHPDVLEVAVVAVPSELTEDEVKAFVVAAPGRSLDFARAAGVDRRTALRVQGPPVLGGRGRAAEDADVAGRQAPPPARPHA